MLANKNQKDISDTRNGDNKRGATSSSSEKMYVLKRFNDAQFQDDCTIDNVAADYFMDQIMMITQNTNST